jgi:hypothetical protein
MYNCPGGVLLVPAPRCVGPECRGGKRGETPTLGYAGDLDAGSRGSFATAGRLIGLTAYDGVEIQKGLSAIDELRAAGEIDGYYAAAAKRAFAERVPKLERAVPFQELTPAAVGPLAPGALGRLHQGRTGEAVGPSVAEGCNCTPRPFDARDPVSGWGIYYVPTGVLLTPSEKCIAGSSKPLRFWEQTWRNVRATFGMPEPPPPRPDFALPKRPAPPGAPPPPQPPPPPPGGYLCLDPRILPMFYRPQPGPCVAPQIPYPGQ